MASVVGVALSLLCLASSANKIRSTLSADSSSMSIAGTEIDLFLSVTPRTTNSQIFPERISIGEDCFCCDFKLRLSPLRILASSERNIFLS